VKLPPGDLEAIQHLGGFKRGGEFAKPPTDVVNVEGVSLTEDDTFDILDVEGPTRNGLVDDEVFGGTEAKPFPWFHLVLDDAGHDQVLIARDGKGDVRRAAVRSSNGDNPSLANEGLNGLNSGHKSRGHGPHESLRLICWHRHAQIHINGEAGLSPMLHR
jgi:hypothetical protein